MNYSARINLRRLKNAFIAPIQGENETQNCLIIPIKDACLHESTNQKTGELCINLDLSCWAPNDNGVDQYGHTHGLKQQFTDKERAAMSEEEKNNLPYLGNLKPMKQQNAISLTQPVIKLDNTEDIPF